MRDAALPVHPRAGDTINHAWLIGAALALTACSQKPQPPAPSVPAAVVAAPAVPAAPACTGDTELVPGVPGSPGHYIPSDINPNGHSELAHRMRLMLAELTALKPAVEAGRAPRIAAGHERIRCSWPTDARDRDAAFDELAVAYLAAVAAYHEAPAVDTFNGIVQGCLDCHAHTCGGPMVAIRPLRIGDAPADAQPGIFD
ncbi:MAG: hypothetical protein CSA66_03415 [Proteobacteria bacterium]|nr:MAG: hypothetical protein CSA66_03415 [Pseudomonadota bacterium]